MIHIAKIGSPHGFKGDIELQVLCSSIENALSYGQWYIKKQHTTKWQKIKNERVYRLGKKILIKFPNIHKKMDLMKYVNALIGIPRRSLPPLKNNEFYQTDLIGFFARNLQGDCFGTVQNIFTTKLNEILICQIKKQQYLIPFIKNYIINIDLSKRNILVDWYHHYT